MWVTWSHIRHRSEPTERFWENAVQGLGKAVLTSYNNSETAVNGYSPAQFLARSVSCFCLAKLIFYLQYHQLCRFHFFVLFYSLSILGAKYEFDISKLVHCFYLHESRPLD